MESNSGSLQQQLLAVALVLAACSSLLAGVVSESTTARRQGAGRMTTSWQSYWDANFPGVPPPASLARLSSQLSSAETANYVNKLRSGQLWATDHSLCKEGTFLCAAHRSYECAITLTYRYDHCSGLPPTQSMLSGLFFRPDKLSAGKKVVYPNQLHNDLQGRTFLPAELAKAMPFTPEKLPSYLALLGVPSGSAMAANMEDTMALCNSKPLLGEILACHSSIESMVHFSVTNLGSKVAILAPPPAAYSTASQEVRVVRHPVTLSLPDKKSISCHRHMFPYVVYACHVMDSSIILDVELQRADGSSFRGISVCHTDTTSWNPAHPAFAALNAQPGDGTLCHWVPQNNFVWIHA